MSRVLIVGAGLSGLTVAAEVASVVPVSVVDRLPVAGGRLGYIHGLIRSLRKVCDARGVRWLLGTTALRWTGDRLLTAGPQGICWHAGEHLVFAGGTRPSTAAELALAGPRLAGVMPASVAVHFLEAGVRLGHRAVVVGCGDWACRAAQELKRQGTPITVVTPDDVAPPDFADAFWGGWTPLEVQGCGRVNRMIVARGAVRQHLPCDAVILGHRPRPLRNVEGAILDGCAVTFVQCVDEVATVQMVQAHARQAAADLRARVGRRER